MCETKENTGEKRKGHLKDACLQDSTMEVMHALSTIQSLSPSLSS